MKKLFAIALIFALIGTISTNVFAAAKKAPKPITGTIVSFDDIVTGNFQTWTLDAAKDASEKGKMFVLLTKKGKTSKIYFIFNEDGTNASKKIAKFAHKEKVGIVGKSKLVNGVNIIIMEMIEGM